MKKQASSDEPYCKIKTTDVARRVTFEVTCDQCNDYRVINADMRTQAQAADAFTREGWRRDITTHFTYCPECAKANLK